VGDVKPANAWLAAPGGRVKQAHRQPPATPPAQAAARHAPGDRVWSTWKHLEDRLAPASYTVTDGASRAA
jgi:hypothetical protein